MVQFNAVAFIMLYISKILHINLINFIELRVNFAEIHIIITLYEMRLGVI